MHDMVSPAADLALAREALHSCPLFADSTMRRSPCALTRCADGASARRGRVPLEDPGDALFVVTSGEIKIVLPSEEGSEPVILTTIGRGGFFGELALLDGRPRSASAIAVRAVEALVLRRDAFDRLVDAEPALRRAMFAALTGEIRRLTGQIADLHFLDLPVASPATSCGWAASRRTATASPAPAGRAARSGWPGRTPSRSWPA